MKLGFDLDGCLANFNVPFYKLLIARHGDRGPKDYNPADPPVWEWPRYLGYTEAEERQCWDEVWSGRSFWQELQAIPGEERTIIMLHAMNVYDGHEIHFITNRKGRAAQYQSAWFLSRYGFNQPSVIIAKEKLPIVRALQLDAYIDDKIETANELSASDITTRIYLRSTAHNQNDRDPKLIVVDSVWEMLAKEDLI